MPWLTSLFANSSRTVGWLLIRSYIVRLRVRRLVLLVVAEAAIADQVDEHVAPERAPEIDREVHRGDARVDVVGVDVHDRHVEAFGQVRSVARRARVGRIGREADLVVRDEVHRAAGLVARQRLQVEDFRDDALAGERGVAVNENRHGALAIDATARRASDRSAARARCLRRPDRPPRDGWDCARA